MITIKSIRYGHANNSSSSHSIVFLGDKKVIDDYNEGEFGWDEFTLSSRKAKEEYMFVQLMYSLPSVTKYSYGVIVEKTITEESNRYSSEYQQRPEVRMYQARVMLKEFSDVFTEINLEEYAQKFVDNDDYGIVDHQSVNGFAVDINGALHYSFVRKILKTIFENNFVILGGNDNSDNNHPHKGHHIENSFSKKIMNVFNLISGNSTESIICVEDEVNGDFILRNKYRGDKIRFSFEKNSPKTKKAGFPELVDIKITSHCAYGCSFCYQSSTAQGQHASLDDVKRVIDILANSKTFEIAIGGGEPTTHPELAKILEHASAKGMSAGFTTRNFKIDEVPGFERIMNTADSIAFSCHSAKEISRVYEIADIVSSIIRIHSERPNFYIQIIPELYTTKHFTEMLDMCANRWMPVTLLGYKDFGFGKSYEPKNLNTSSDWIDVVKGLSKKRDLKIGIDSVLVKKWKKELIEKGCNKLMLVGEEGKFSCYVDAVEKRIAKSSFIDESEPLDMEKSTILEEFKKY
jgi:organic radical activating enzyme